LNTNKFIKEEASSAPIFRGEDIVQDKF